MFDNVPARYDARSRYRIRVYRDFAEVEEENATNTPLGKDYYVSDMQQTMCLVEKLVRGGFVAIVGKNKDVWMNEE